MATAYRSSQSVLNSTAGTSVTMSKPAGIVDTGAATARDQLIAFIAAAGAPGITPPAGWTLITSAVDATTAITLWAYRRLASSEGASWTWTLGSAQRGWGYVGAYTGVDPNYPVASFSTDLTISSGTNLAQGDNAHQAGGHTVNAGAAVRTASGTATTWTNFNAGTERIDVSTNAGSGTDITGIVADGADSTPTVSGAWKNFSAAQTFASQAQTAGVGIGIGLFPNVNFVPSNPVGFQVLAAFGADPDGDQSLWTWTDITQYVRVESGISIRKGKSDRAGQADPTTVQFELNSPGGLFTPGMATSAFYPNVVRNLPLQVWVNSVSPASERATVLADSFTPGWDSGNQIVTCAVRASGRLQRVRQGSNPIRSPAFRQLSGSSVFYGSAVVPVAYWSCEDGPTASAAASAIGGTPMQATGAISWASDSSLAGSAALPTLGADGRLAGIVPPYPTTGHWFALAAVKIGASVSVDTVLVDIRTNGTASHWQILLSPGSPDTLRVRAFDIANAQVLDDGVNVDEANYGQFAVYTLEVTQNGSNVDYEVWQYVTGGGAGATGTLTSRTHGQALTVTAPAGLASPVGHFAVYSATPDMTTVKGAVLGGNSGDYPWERFRRLLGEEGIPSSDDAFLSGNQVIKMGVQPISILASLLTEVEMADGGVIHDAATDVYHSNARGVLYLNQRERRHNQNVNMTIDVTGGQLALGFQPVLDDQGIGNDVTASRTNGSSATFTNDVNIGKEGRYQDPITLNLDADSLLTQFAAWHSALSTVEGMRYPQIGLNFRNPSTALLMPQWLQCSIGSRVQAINPPPGHPPDPIDAFIEGYSEYLNVDAWTVTLACGPARPYDVVTLEAGANRSRLDNDQSTLMSSVSNSATSLQVYSANDILWSTTGVPYDLEVSGERVTATAVSGILRDTYTRSVSSNWGTPDVGPSWTTSGGSASDYSANGSKGIQSQGTVAVLRHCLADVGVTDLRVRGIVNLDTGTVTGAGATAFLCARAADTSNYYTVELIFNTDDSVAIALAKRVAGTLTTLVGPTTISAGFGAGQQFTVDLILGGTTIRAKGWDASTPEPDWVLYTTDASLTTGGKIIAASRLETGNTNSLPVQVQWDNIQVLNPQTMTVTRSVNTVVKAQAAGAQVKLWRPSVLAL